MSELSWADWDWLIDYIAGDDEETPLESLPLHAPSPDAQVFFGSPDWDADSWSGAVLCGAESQAWGIPGIFSRMNRARCPQCCDLTGYPQGIGSPKNDPECRKLLKPPGGCDQQERETDQGKCAKLPGAPAPLTEENDNAR